MLYVLFVLFGVLNVLVGTFVTEAALNVDENMAIQMEMRHRDQFVRNMRRLFHGFSGKLHDASEGGLNKLHAITWDKFQECISSEETQAYLATQQLEFSDAYNLFKIMDHDQSGQVDIVEFIYACLHLRGPARSTDLCFLSTQVDSLNHSVLAIQKVLCISELRYKGRQSKSRKRDDVIGHASERSRMRSETPLAQVVESASQRNQAL